MDLTELAIKLAADKFGTARTEELRADLEQLVSDLEKLRSFPLDVEDGP